jgi:hypothetical protein
MRERESKRGLRGMRKKKKKKEEEKKKRGERKKRATVRLTSRRRTE